MDRNRGSIFGSPVLLFVGALAVTMLASAILMLVPTMAKLAIGMFAAIPIVITICGIVSCICSEKPANIILLWIIIMIIAPLLGPLLWFAWGRKNT
ncbi:MAG TPA: PLDc N-terminal domain-containing protein [Verrucomicrobiae bacterium]